MQNKVVKPAVRPSQAVVEVGSNIPKGRFECWIGFLLGVGGLLASRLGELWIAFDVFSQFTLQFAVVALAFLLGLLVPRAKIFLAFVVLVGGLAAIGVWPHLASRSPQILGGASDKELEFRIASFNTLYDNNNVDEVKAEIVRLDADVIALIEFGPNKQGMLDSLAAQYPHKAQCFQEDYCQIAILSKVPFAKTLNKTNWDGPPMVVAEFGPELGNVTVLATHTIRFPHSRAQLRQVQEMSNYMDTVSGRKILVGDFNATPFSRIIRTIAAQTGLTRLTLLPTWPAHIGLPQFAIDHVFASSEIRMVEEETIGQKAGSDHYPISIRLAVPKAQ